MKKPVTFIQAAIPSDRGMAEHYERYDELAQTVIGSDGKVKEIHTPQDSFRRVHEVLHARHTKHNMYRGIRTEVREIVEDCRLHLKHWPWKGERTPQVIVDDAKELFKRELKRKKAYEQEFGPAAPFDNFAQTMRMNSTLEGIGGIGGRRHLGSYQTHSHQSFANHLRSLILHGYHQKAAEELELAFFGKSEDEKTDKPKPGESDEAEYAESDEESDEDIDEEEDECDGIPTMEIIELAFVEDTHHADKGFRLTTTGSRIYRPALRRPVLPQRLFLKQAPIAPGGSILFDASGSMHVDQEKLLDCIRRAPAATVAFYSGDGGQGKLYVYAKDGKRAIEEYLDITDGNTVDGPALDWLLKQESPRIFVTDRGFCGAIDSDIQKVRLANHEMMGDLEVYESYDQFQEQFPPIEPLISAA